MPYKNPEDRRNHGRRYREAHRDERNARERRYYQANTVKQRDRKLAAKYGVSAADYDAMLEHQEGRCAACKEFHFLVVDHDHGTGEVRGLLCGPCNTLAGALESAKRSLVEQYLVNPPGLPGQPPRGP